MIGKVPEPEARTGVLRLSVRTSPRSSFLVAMRSSIMISCLLSSSVHALLVPATRPAVITNHPAAPRLGTPVMKGSLGRRVLLLAPLAPLLAAPASVLAAPPVAEKRAPSLEDKRKAERQKEAKRWVELQKKQQERTRREVSTGNNAKKDPKKARQQLADVKKKNAKEQARAAKQRAAKFKEEAKIARIKEDKRRLAQGKKVRSRSGLGFFQTVLLVGGVGTAALVLAPDENSADGAPPAPVEDAAPAEAVEETAA